MAYCSQNRVQYRIQFPANVFSKESQHQITALLPQLVFSAIAAVRNRVTDIFNDFALQHDIQGRGFTALYQNFLETQVASVGIRYRF